MSLRRTATSNVLWLVPVLVACSPLTDIAKNASVGGSNASGASPAHTGGTSAGLAGGSSAGPTGGFIAGPTGGTNAVPTGGASTVSTGGSHPAPSGGASTATTGGSSTKATAATAGSSLGGTGGTTGAGGSMSMGGHAGTATTLLCTGLSEAECSAKQEQCTSTYGYTKPNLSGTRTYVGCHTGFGCTAATTCGYPAGQPESCLLFASGCLPDGWVADSSCRAPACPNSSTAAGGATGIGGGPSTGGSAATLGGASSTGGSSSIGVHPRVIVMDPDSDRFAAYDAEGQLVHDYRSLLDVGTGYGDRVVCIDTIDHSWDGTSSNPFSATTVLSPPGQDPPLAPTELVVTAQVEYATKPMAKVRVANIGGQVTDEFTLLGNWQGFLSSPSRLYLQGGNSGTTGVVVRRSDHGSVWQGPLYQAGFAPDDKHLIVIPTSTQDAALTVELSTGQATNYDLSALPDGFKSPTDLYVRGTFNSGAVLTGNRPNNAGYALYWASWDGTITPLDPTVPVGVDEWPGAANRDATRLTFSRKAHAAILMDPSLLGWFEVDVGTTNTRALSHLNDTSADCYDAAVTTYYTLSDGTLSQCNCVTGACSSFASWTPPSDNRWSPELFVSPLRGFVGVDYQWRSQTAPATSTPALLYSEQGMLLASVESAMYGATFAFDRLDEIALIGSFKPMDGTTIFSTASGHTTPLGNAAWLAFGYE